MCAVILTLLICSAASGDYRTDFGDGSWHDIGGGWEYAYSSALDNGYWRYNGTIRFACNYYHGQWWDYGRGWYTLGAACLSQTFIGDGTPHNLLDGFSFRYDDDLSIGYRLVGDANRFRYDYTNGDWYHYGPVVGDFQLATGVSAQFLGVYTKSSPLHTPYGCYYWYDAASGIGYLSMTSGGNPRFHYVYSNGQWFHYGPVDTAGQALSAPGRSAMLIVSYNSPSNSFDLGTGFNYWYNGAAGIWAAAAGDRFAYAYWTGECSFWQASSAWQRFGATGVSAAFIGDGAEHLLGSGYYWKAQYADDAGTDVLNFYLWTDNEPTEKNYLRYNFTTGCWQDRNRDYGWADVAGYYLDSDGPSVLSLRKSDYSYLMDLMFGTSQYDGKDIVALYWENGTVPDSYHDYVNCGWYNNDNYPNIDPMWTFYETGPTDMRKPPR